MSATMVTFESLVGRHVLTGVDMDRESIKREWGPSFEYCDTLRFVLDGVTYRAVEDPDDGYRSAMGEFSISEAPVKNTFAKVRVLARVENKSTYGGPANILQLIDERNGLVVLEVGTDNTDDYYPSWVGRWVPENLWRKP